MEEEMRFIIITGLSGAGRTLALRIFEDHGYFCVDNLPPALIPKFAELCRQTRKNKIALVIDIRGGDFFDHLFESLKSLKNMGYSYEILFLDASDEVLIKRYKESRRRHPLAPERRIIDGINLERKKLEPLKAASNVIIDTSYKTPAQLKEEIVRRFIETEKETGLLINLVSFGFKQGLPLDADLVFDVRFLPNPFYVDELRMLSGNDPRVREFVMNCPESQKFLEKLTDLLKFLIPCYIREGKSQLVIAVGCTGGRHRSVAIVNELASLLRKEGHKVIVEHRDENSGGGEKDEL
ncbi:Nucleotide-binding protein YvcJ [Fervidicola ferrireducens]|uniref:Nucleotide-binding protein YvcJ n=2 Tax=Fervidicola ferrireducens TaxID=520764 RepID=A0A140LDF1_9FIRM|nr:RNase adapter RapZ [Fervidicola ferrireducens]KXG78576.1 Nucleotide-binding protein YvcJ [Fervidicola ferrireducens]